MRRRSRIRTTLLAATAGVVVGAAACGGESSPPPRAEPFMVLPPLAGVSARQDIEVEPVTPGDFGADTTGPLWHRFKHRCSACHVAPSPAQHAAGEWDRVVDRMGENIESAGLLPLSDRDAAAIAEFLREHAERPR